MRNLRVLEEGLYEARIEREGEVVMEVLITLMLVGMVVNVNTYPCANFFDIIYYYNFLGKIYPKVLGRIPMTYI